MNRPELSLGSVLGSVRLARSSRLTQRDLAVLVSWTPEPSKAPQVGRTAQEPRRQRPDLTFAATTRRPELRTPAAPTPRLLDPVARSTRSSPTRTWSPWLVIPGRWSFDCWPVRASSSCLSPDHSCFVETACRVDPCGITRFGTPPQAAVVSGSVTCPVARPMRLLPDHVVQSDCSACLS